MKKLKIGGLTKKWIVNVLLTIFVFLVVLNIAIGWLTYNYYYDSVYQVMDTHLSIISENFRSYVSASDADFDRAALDFAETYEDKELFEVQIFSEDATMLVSTTGFTSDESEIPDYNQAITEGGGREGVFRGTLSSGEKVMAVTAALGNNSKRAVRMIVSMESADVQISRIILVVVAVSLGFFLVIVMTGVYFLRGIVTPLKNINTAARQIAQGNFDIQIKTDSKSEIGELCIAINDMANELKSSEELKNNFISTVSHELRTPLTAIRGWSETVKYATDDPEIVQKGMDVISRESDRLNTIVEDLLDFSRLQNGALKYDLQPCDINVPLSEVITAFAEAVHHAGLSVEYQPLPLPEIMADSVRLKQVFVNIIDNAIKNTPEGGRIIITEEITEDSVDVLIRDTGKGIKKEDLEKIKIKFYKAEANKTVRGSGIGLSITDEIIKAHYGTLTITSEVGVGTLVRVSLPMKKEIK